MMADINNDFGIGAFGYYCIKIISNKIDGGNVYSNKIYFMLEDRREGCFMQSIHNKNTYIVGDCYVMQLLRFTFRDGITRFCDDPDIIKAL